jgi:hypothetical protein
MRSTARGAFGRWQGDVGRGEAAEQRFRRDEAKGANQALDRLWPVARAVLRAAFNRQPTEGWQGLDGS